MLPPPGGPGSGDLIARSDSVIMPFWVREFSASGWRVPYVRFWEFLNSSGPGSDLNTIRFGTLESSGDRVRHLKKRPAIE